MVKVGVTAQEQLAHARIRIAELEQALAQEQANRRVPPEVVALKQQVKSLKKQLEVASARVKDLEKELQQALTPRPSQRDLDSVKMRAELQGQFFAELNKGDLERAAEIIRELEVAGATSEAEACRTMLARQQEGSPESLRARRR